MRRHKNSIRIRKAGFTPAFLLREPEYVVDLFCNKTDTLARLVRFW